MRVMPSFVSFCNWARFSLELAIPQVRSALRHDCADAQRRSVICHSAPPPWQLDNGGGAHSFWPWTVMRRSPHIMGTRHLSVGTVMSVMNKFLTSKENVAIELIFELMGQYRYNRSHDGYLAIAARLPRLRCFIATSMIDERTWLPTAWHPIRYVTSGWATAPSI
jgi:hypothetical protein